MTPPTPLAALPFVAAYAAVVLVVGYAAVSAALPAAARHWAEVAGLSVAAGVALTAFALFDASTAGLAPSRGVLAAWAVVAAVSAAAVLWRKGRLLQPTVPSPRKGLDPMGVVGLLAAAVVVAAVLNAAAAGTTPGLGDIDEYATWMFKAKVVAAVPLRPIPPALLDPGLSYSHQDYPLLFPLLVAGLYRAVGRVDESAGKLLLLPMYLALIGIVYGAVRRHLRRATAVAVTAVAVAGPVVVQKAGLAVAELPITLFFAATVSLLARWAEGGDSGDLLLAGGFAAAAAFTKNEGLAMLPVFAVAATLAAWMRRPNPLAPGSAGGGPTGTPRAEPGANGRALLAASVIAVALIGPWLLYRRGLPKTHEDYGGKFTTATTLIHGVARLPHVVAGVAGGMLDVWQAGGLWVVLAVAAVAGRRAWRRPAVRIVWVVLLLQIGLYVAAFGVTPWDVDVLLPMVTGKLLAQAAPAAGLLVGLHVAALWPHPVGRPPRVT